MKKESNSIKNERFKSSWDKQRTRRARQRKKALANYGDYRKLIEAELKRRKSVSPYYSLRDFAKDIGISPSQLSRVLNGERGLSWKTAEKVAACLGLSLGEGNRFLFHVQAISARSLGMRNAAMGALDIKLGL